jgi:hypothetical protein
MQCHLTAPPLYSTFNTLAMYSIYMHAVAEQVLHADMVFDYCMLTHV